MSSANTRKRSKAAMRRFRSSAWRDTARRHKRHYMALANPMTKNEKYAAYAAVGGAVILGGALLYHFSKAKSASGSTSGSKTINVNAATATVNNILNTPVHANVGDTIAVQLGPPLSGSWVDQSSSNLVLQLPITGFQMRYLVKGSGTIAIAWQAGNPVGGVTPPQVVAFPVVVP